MPSAEIVAYTRSESTQAPGRVSSFTSDALRPSPPSIIHESETLMPSEYAKPPSTLSKEAKSWWLKLTEEYALDDQAGLLLLMVAMEAFDLMRSAQAAVAEDGAVLADRYGSKKAHPACQVVKDARAQLLAALKQLNLDIEPLRDRIGRPPGS